MKVPGAMNVAGMWLPETERHMQILLKSTKHPKDGDGNLLYQYQKYKAARKFFIHRKSRVVAIDVGAHCGLWTRYMVMDFKTVICFEPLQINYELIPYNVRSYAGDAQNFKIYKLGLGSERKTALIRVPQQCSGFSFIDDNREKEIKGKYTEERIDIKTLDSYEFYRVDFIKIDVQGYELEVLKGAKLTINRCRPVIVVEQKSDELYTQPAVKYLVENHNYDQRGVVSGDHIMVPGEM